MCCERFKRHKSIRNKNILLDTNHHLSPHLPVLLFFFQILFIYSWETQRHRQREKQAACREPDVGLDPRTPGSWPELKVDTEPLSHSGGPPLKVFKTNFSVGFDPKKVMLFYEMLLFEYEYILSSWNKKAIKEEHNTIVRIMTYFLKS